MDNPKRMRYTVIGNGTYKSLPVTIIEETYQDSESDHLDTLFVWQTKNQLTIFEVECHPPWGCFEDRIVIFNYPLEIGKMWSYLDSEDYEVNVKIVSKDPVFHSCRYL